MNFSLFLVFEGSPELGPVPICRVADADLTKNVAAFALDRASRRMSALRLVSEEASADASFEVDKLRSVLASI